MNEPLTREDAAELMALPLDQKWQQSNARIFEWATYWDGAVYVAFSGGKDSTVLAYLVAECFSMFRSMPKELHLVFSNTGMEYLEIQRFTKEFAEWINQKFPSVKTVLDVVRPKKPVSEVVSTYGYPIINKDVAHAIAEARTIYKNKSGKLTVRREQLLGVFEKKDGRLSFFDKGKYLSASQNLPFMISHMCCDIMKRRPSHAYEKKTGRKPYIGTLAKESRNRKQAWIRTGCNAYDEERPKSTPMAFWTEQDVLRFIVDTHIPICSVYGDIVSTDGVNDYTFSLIEQELRCTGCDRTGCVYCCFGAHINGNNRFLELAKLSPRQYEYAMGGGQWADNPKYDPAAPEYDGDWMNWNPKKIWVPSKEGLGLSFAINEFNQLYPDNKIQLP